jgi:hypothetical protein
VKRLIAIVPLLAVACGTFGVQAHAITLAYKAGDSYKYKLHATVDYTVAMQGVSVPLKLDVTGDETATVKSVDSSGTADVNLAIANVSARTTIGGTTNTTTAGKTISVELQVASDGRILSVNGNALDSDSLPGLTPGGLISAILPDNTVKPGDTWTKDYDQANPKGTGSVHVTTKNKYARDETVNGVSTAVVQSNITSAINLTFDTSTLAGAGGTITLPGASSAITRAFAGITVKGTTTFDVTSWIDVSARRLVKTHSTGTLDGTITLMPGPAQASPTPTASAPRLTGPITIKGTQTLDVDPA